MISPSQNDATRHIRDFYNAFASRYDAFYDDIDYEAWAVMLAAQMAPMLPANAILLDIGCGTGNLTIPLAARLGCTCIGIDVSWQMLRCFAAKRPPMSPIRLVHANGFALGVHDAAIDIALGSFSLLNLYGGRQRKRLLQQVYRVLKPGGHFIFDIITHRRLQQIPLSSSAPDEDHDSDFGLSRRIHAARRIVEKRLSIDGANFCETIHLIEPKTLAATLARTGFELQSCRSLMPNIPTKNATRLLYTVTKPTTSCHRRLAL